MKTARSTRASKHAANLEDIVTTVQDPFLGLEALALASIRERTELTPRFSVTRHAVLQRFCRNQIMAQPSPLLALSTAN